MDKICQNCKHHALAPVDKYKNLNVPYADWVSVCRLKSILVSPYNHCPKFEPLVAYVQLSFSYDANGSPTDEEV